MSGAAGRGRPSPPSAAELGKLPSDGGTAWNRLVFEKSPYLLQHAANPVDWRPWGDEAFAAARQQDKPVFLSIGYSTCHWCHVMEHESFEDEEIAQLLNAAFVCVKVDREERPDVDQAYMTVTQALTGSGGWPMTVLLTPDKRPFFAGTYFPKEGRYGRPGMRELVPALDTAWRTDRKRLLASAEKIVQALSEMTSGAPGGPEPGIDALHGGAEQLAARFDPDHGGFGRAPKFPTPHDHAFLLRYWKREGIPHARAMAETTLEAMRRGGIWDHVGFGLHRYSTDQEWLLPHFEKMLYDQALLAMACVEARHATGGEQHARVAREVFEYVLRDLTSPDGAFLSAEDADSEGVEGKFYLWTPEQLTEVLGEDDGTLVARVFGVVEGGNFRDQATGERTGESILHLRQPLSEAAAALGTDEAELAARWDSARKRLFAAREKRVHPFKDDKVLTDWNGLMIAALARGARVLEDSSLSDAAARAADFVLRELRRPDGRLLKRWRDGEAAMPAVLDDHAFLAWGLLELYEATFDVRWLEEAVAVTDVMRAHFGDEAGGGFFLAADDGEKLPVRAKESHDGACPSGNSVAALVLLRLARMTGRTELEDGARGIFRAFAGGMRQAPSGHAQALMALDFALGPSAEVVIAGERDAPDTKAMVATLQRAYEPNVVFMLRPSGEQGDRLARIAPHVQAMRPQDGRATAYVCRNQACQTPTTDAAVALRQLRAATTPTG